MFVFGLGFNPQLLQPILQYTYQTQEADNMSFPRDILSASMLFTKPSNKYPYLSICCAYSDLSSSGKE